MYKVWQKKSQEKIKEIVFEALNNNVNYEEQNILGVPASYLDEKVFSQDDSFLKEAPFISTLVHNPNHIGCHTLGESEHYFAGTQEIEKELIAICAEDILKADVDATDGYVASGGTEANIQAIWIYRNFFKSEYAAKQDEIVIICSEDSHYSMDKGADILNIDIKKIPVDEYTREMDVTHIKSTLSDLQLDGYKYFIVVNNMMTTMFGSIDNVSNYIEALKACGCIYKIHVDGAFGGFYYPFLKEKSLLTFENEDISSFTLDAHKMAQAPYGTGVFLIRKGMMNYAGTKAGYVEGNDFTLIGSRSGANAVAVWMILVKNGPYGWYEKLFILKKRTDWMCQQLENLNIIYFRDINSNIITIKSLHVTPGLAATYGLIPDNHLNPIWYKIVIMAHVSIEKLLPLLEGLQDDQYNSECLKNG